MRPETEKLAERLFASEADLCASLSVAAGAQGWTVYPETADFDLLLVKEGIQVGVEAKLRCSMELLCQIADRLGSSRFHYGPRRGPHYIAAAVPEHRGPFETVARALGALVLLPFDAPRRDPARTWTDIATVLAYVEPLHFEEPAWTPPVVPEVPAGVPAPVKLTPWKWSALRLLARLEIRGYVTIADFQDIGLNASRWYHLWLVQRNPGGRPAEWIRREGALLADTQHPAEFAVALAREWEVLARFDAQRPAQGRLLT